MSEKNKPSERFLIKDVLVRLEISQRKLAKLTDSTQDWIGRICLGKQQPKWETVLRIARALGVSVGVFVDNDPARIQFFQRGHSQVIDPMAAAKDNGKGKPPATIKRTRSKRTSATL